MQNSWLVSKTTAFLVKDISKQILAHFQPMFHLNKLGSLFLVKFGKKHLWKSDILIKDAGISHASLLKMPFYQKYFLAHFASENQLTI